MKSNRTGFFENKSQTRPSNTTNPESLKKEIELTNAAKYPNPNSLQTLSERINHAKQALAIALKCNKEKDYHQLLLERYSCLGMLHFEYATKCNQKNLHYILAKDNFENAIKILLKISNKTTDDLQLLSNLNRFCAKCYLNTKEYKHAFVCMTLSLEYLTTAGALLSDDNLKTNNEALLTQIQREMQIMVQQNPETAADYMLDLLRNKTSPHKTTDSDVSKLGKFSTKKILNEEVRGELLHVISKNKRQ